MKLLQYKRLLLIPLLGVLLWYCSFTQETKDTTVIQTNPDTDYVITVNRGAFHYDAFVLTNDTIQYIPDTTSSHSKKKYNSLSKKALDKPIVTEFLKEIEKKGFWTLKDTYISETSCNSQLIITIAANQKSKTVICDDFERGCPDVIKYIDKKVVEFEGNNLKRIYLPG